MAIENKEQLLSKIEEVLPQLSSSRDTFYQAAYKKLSLIKEHATKDDFSNMTKESCDISDALTSRQEQWSSLDESLSEINTFFQDATIQTLDEEERKSFFLRY